MPAIVPDALQERVDVVFHGGNLFTELCEPSSCLFTEACDTGNLRKSHNAAMKDDLHERRLKAFLDAQGELERSGKIESLNDWCTRAGLTWSTIGEFMAGRTRVMSDRTYAKLADAVGWTVARLKGDPEQATLDPLEAEYFAMFRTLSKEEKRKEIKALRARLADDEQQ